MQVKDEPDGDIRWIYISATGDSDLKVILTLHFWKQVLSAGFCTTVHLPLLFSVNNGTSTGHTQKNLLRLLQLVQRIIHFQTQAGSVGPSP